MRDSAITSPELALELAAQQVSVEGWCTTTPVADAEIVDCLVAELHTIEPTAGLRNLLAVSEHARRLASSPAVRRIPELILGARCFVTRAILFDKTPASNWKVPWHQDLAIAVATRHDTPGFGPWSVKDGVVHVQPPAAVLAGMLTVRVHLDECGLENGPLRVLPRTHAAGKLSVTQIEQLRASTSEIACTARRGGLMAFRPLLLHASSPSTNPGHRRVAHFEFAASELPGGLDWQLRWS